mgnify:CR=1 FL=1
MQWLMVGLVLFIAAHSTRIVAEGWRAATLERLGEKPWKGLISVVSIAGFALMVIGYSQARLVPVPLWEPPLWTRHLSLLLNLLAFILLSAAYVPRNAIKARIGHPMVAGVKLWALAHLLANGNLADVLLFGSFLLWAVLNFRAARRRDRDNEIRYPQGILLGSFATLAIGIVAWFVFVSWLHLRLIGVSPLGI